MSQKNEKTRQPPALNPESPRLVQPYAHFVQMGWAEYKLSATASTLKSTFSLNAVLLEGNETVGLEISPAQLKERVVLKKLWSPKGNTSKKDKEDDPLPKRSLVKKDFEGGDKKKLLERVVAVATALGSDNARGRIGSLNLMRDGITAFDKWWSVAPGSAKAKLLADGKHWKQFTRSETDLLGSVSSNCPFRGTVPTPKEEEKEE